MKLNILVLNRFPIKNVGQVILQDMEYNKIGDTSPIFKIETSG